VSARWSIISRMSKPELPALTLDKINAVKIITAKLLERKFHFQGQVQFSHSIDGAHIWLKYSDSFTGRDHKLRTDLSYRDGETTGNRTVEFMARDLVTKFLRERKKHIEGQVRSMRNARDLLMEVLGDGNIR
jgi:hypothetical protein